MKMMLLFLLLGFLMLFVEGEFLYLTQDDRLFHICIQEDNPDLSPVLAELYNEKFEGKIIYKVQGFQDQKADLEKMLEMKTHGCDIFSYFSGGSTTKKLIKENKLMDLHDAYVEYGLYDLIPQNFIDPVSGSNGHPYMFPYGWYHWGIYFNPKWLQDLGVAVPTDYESFLASCEKCKQSGVLPISMGSKYRWPLAGWFDYLNMRINGPEFHQNLTSGSIPYDDWRVKRVFEEWGKLYEKEYFPSFENASNYTWIRMSDDLYDSKACFALMGDFIRNMRGKENLQVLNFIQFPIIDKSIPIGEDVPVDGFGINIKTSYKKEAFSYLGLFSTPEHYINGNARLGLPSTQPNLTKTYIQDPQTLKGAEMVAKADVLFQFYDRDTQYEMAMKGLEAMFKFHEDPQQIDNLLEELETYRKQIYFNLAASPVFDMEGGKYDHPILVNATTKTANSEIRFTLDGSYPTAISEVFDPNIGILIDKDGRILVRAVTFADGFKSSKVSERAFYMNLSEKVEKDNQKLIVSFVVVVIVGALAFMWIFMRHKRDSEKVDVKNLEIITLEQELEQKVKFEKRIQFIYGALEMYDIISDFLALMFLLGQEQSDFAMIVGYSVVIAISVALSIDVFLSRIARFQELQALQKGDLQGVSSAYMLNNSSQNEGTKGLAQLVHDYASIKNKVKTYQKMIRLTFIEDVPSAFVNGYILFTSPLGIKELVFPILALTCSCGMIGYKFSLIQAMREQKSEQLSIERKMAQRQKVDSQFVKNFEIQYDINNNLNKRRNSKIAPKQ